MDVRIGLGWARLGNSARYLQVKANYPTNTTASPYGLRYNFQRGDVEVYTAGPGLSQVKAPEVFADVVVNSASSYSVQLYSPTNVLNYTNGRYQLTNDPYRTITIENPGGDTNSVRITDSGDNSTYDYTWQGNGWLLSTGNGLRNELRVTAAAGTNTSTTTTTVWTGSDPAVESRVETWQTFPTCGPRLVGEVFGTGDAARTNTYLYTTNGYLQEVVRWDGSWEYRLYDTLNRPTQVFSGFETQGPTTNPALCRVVEYNYSTNAVSGSGDNGARYFLTPRCTTEYIKGTEVSRRYFVGLANERREIQCPTSGAAWSDPKNLVTTYKLFGGNPASSFHFNEPQVIIRPDGTGVVFQYGAIGPSTTNIVLTGHLDGTGVNVDAGTRTTNVLGATGQLLQKTVVDVQSGIVIGWETNSYDELGRLASTTFLDGTSRQTSYDCCAVSSQTDRDGTVTTFTHDALKRLLTTTVNGITSSNVYDPAGNILAVLRFGTDSSAITTSQATFDDSGLQTSSTDALGHPTYYTNYLEASRLLINKTTFNDASTRIEARNRDGSLQSLTGTAVFPARYEYGVETDGAYTKEIKLDADGTDTSEWTKTYRDTAGRAYKTVYASASGSPFSISRYNVLGQLTNQVDPDGVSLLHLYGLQGERTYSVLDSNRNYAIDWSGPDRITLVTNDVITDNGIDLRRTMTGVWATAGDTGTVISQTETSTDGLSVWNTVWNDGQPVVTRADTVFDAAHGYRIVTVTAPDGSTTVTTNQYGRLISVTRKDSSGASIGQALYGYDAHGQHNTVTDARNGTTTFFFNDADQVSGIVSPSPDGVQPPQATTNYFDNMGRVWKTTLPDGTSVTNEFWPTGALKKNYGSRVYPTESGIDAQGRPRTLTTWQDFGAGTGAATTTWNYDLYRGLVTNKVYAGGAAGPTFGYTPGARLQSRLLARGITTTLSHNNAGDPSGTSYDDGSTAAVTAGQDRRGRQTTITQGQATITRTLDDAGNLLSESYSGGPLDGLMVTNRYDQFLRRTNLAILNSQSSILASTDFAYDSSSRLKGVSAGTSSAAYAYVASSPLVGQIALTNNATVCMLVTKDHDLLNRLTNISSAIGPSAVGYSYGYNLANQRTNATLADDSHWAFGYDSLGQVTSGKKYWPDATPVAGQQFEYAFDDIGNRKTAAWGGDSAGQNLRTAYYTNNLLNWLTGRSVPGFAQVLGSAATNATVTLWGDHGAYATTARRGDYFRGELAATNSSAAVWLTITNLGVLQQGTNADILSSVTGSVLLPRNPETFGYDSDGNLTNNGAWTIAWDAENRATALESLAALPSTAKQRIQCAYDGTFRRTEKIISTWNGSAYVPQSTNHFVYDGWNLVAILDAQSSVLQSFVWGLDASGTEQGAGGVGGLLATTIHTGPFAGTYFPAYDGNYNVVAYIRASDGQVVTQYEYGPFGEMLRASGSMAKEFNFLFSTKYYDWETGLYYYGYRYYDPSTGRWLSRDPIGELGGLHLYQFCLNAPPLSVDPLGLDKLRLTFESAVVSDWESYMEPSDAVFVRRSSQILDAAKARVGRYDPKGRCGNCIKTLILAGHGGQGEIPLGDLTYLSQTYQTYLATRNSAAPTAPIWLRSSEARNIFKAHQLLEQLAALKCEEGIEVTVVACNSGQGHLGTLLRQQLRDLFGQNATITTFSGRTGFLLGFPVPMDPFGLQRKPPLR